MIKKRDEAQLLNNRNCLMVVSRISFEIQIGASSTSSGLFTQFSNHVDTGRKWLENGCPRPNKEGLYKE